MPTMWKKPTYEHLYKVRVLRKEGLRSSRKEPLVVKKGLLELTKVPRGFFIDDYLLDREAKLEGRKMGRGGSKAKARVWRHLPVSDEPQGKQRSIKLPQEATEKKM